MNTLDVGSILIKSLSREGYGIIQLLSEDDVSFRLGAISADTLPKNFLEAHWEIRDFELLLDITGNLDAPL